MPTSLSEDGAAFVRRLAGARAGSPDALGKLLMDCRNYLLLTADQKLDPHLRGKVSPSDVVQDTFLEAQRDFEQFHGQRAGEWLAWVTCILLHNLANAARDFRATSKRDLSREVPLMDVHAENGTEREPCVNTPSPSQHAEANEKAQALELALAELPEHYRRVLQLRYEEQRTFADIGAVLNCSAEAARKLWARAVDQLQQKLGSAP